MQLRSIGLSLMCCGFFVSGAYASDYDFLARTVLGKLTPEDVKIGTAAVVSALNSGNDGEWSNPTTGTSGKISILKTLDIGQHKGCRKARLDVAAGARNDHGTYILCKRSSGTWAFYSVSGS